MFKRGIFMLCVLWAGACLAEPGYLPKPPTFDINTDPESTLDDYPRL
jgi:hypothetical protein